MWHSTRANHGGDSTPHPPIAFLYEKHGAKYCHRFLVRFRRSGFTPLCLASPTPPAPCNPPSCLRRRAPSPVLYLPTDGSEIRGPRQEGKVEKGREARVPQTSSELGSASTATLVKAHLDRWCR
uniref:Uncharacterized protein n=1 Tax=Oryza punctata TaxID=4537 RepID=A0A0E0LAA5_ORYPU